MSRAAHDTQLSIYLSICLSIYPSLAEEISAGSLHVCQDVLALRVGDVNLARRARPNVLIDDGGGGGGPLVVGLQRVVLRLESSSSRVKAIGHHALHDSHTLHGCAILLLLLGLVVEEQRLICVLGLELLLEQRPSQ